MLQNDFEQGMQILANSQSTLLAPLQRSMAGFFFRFVPSRNSLYVKMANLIKQSQWNLRGALISFNYERMLPIALTRSNLRPILLPSPQEIRDNCIELCLPHGACNIFCGGIQGHGFAFSSGIIFEGGRPEIIIEPQQFWRRITGDVIPPIMSYFVPNKINASGRDFIIKMRERYKTLVLGANKIAIIGLRVRPHDHHIWDPLSKTHAKIIYCAGNQAHSEFLDWCKQNRVGKENKSFEGYFADNFFNICNELGIT